MTSKRYLSNKKNSRLSFSTSSALKDWIERYVNVNNKKNKMLINAYGDQTGELSANTPIQFLRYRKNTETCWQEVLINNIGKEITKTDYI